MRKRLTLVFALGAVVALVAAAAAVAGNGSKATVRLGNLQLSFSGKISPKALPKKTLAPVSLTASAGLTTTDGSPTPALKEVITDVDKNGAVNPQGLATCKAGQLEARDSKSAEAVCKDSIVGQGTTHLVIYFAEQAPIPVTSKLLAFNGGIKGGVTTIFIHAFVSVPAPSAVVTTVKIKKEHKGRYGEHAVASVPVIVGGQGSVSSFSLTLHRLFTNKGKKQSYFLAKCPDGHLNATGEAVFRNNNRLHGAIVVPCTPKG